MSSNIDPFFLFTHPSNLAALTQLLETEKFEVVEVKKTVGPCNNTIAHVDLLYEDEDDDGLPLIVKSGIRREIIYDRDPLQDALATVLPVDPITQSLYIEVDESAFIDETLVANTLREYGLDVGEDAIIVEIIKTTDVIDIHTTDKSVRFSDSARILVVKKLS